MTLIAATLMLLGSVVVAATPASAAVAGGQIFTWGNNDSGQLGRPPASGSLTPGAVSLPLPPGTLLTDVEAGLVYVLALTSTGQVYAWGANDRGQLGDGTTTDRDRPVLVNLPGLASGVTVTAIAAGPWLSLALTSAGDVYSWGNSAALGRAGSNTTPGKVELPAGTVATGIDAGQDFAAAVTSTGTVYAWGDNTYGQLGTGDNQASPLPTLMVLPSGVQAAEIATGYAFTLILTPAGKVYGTGENSGGTLGNGTKTNSNVPVPAVVPAGTVFRAIDAGFIGSLGLTADGQVWGWGNYNVFGGAAAASATPVRVAALPRGVVFVEISGGHLANLAVSANRQVYGWGFNGNGQLGDGTTTSRANAVRAALPEGSEATAVAIGSNFAVAVVRTALDLAFGANGSGQLGNYSHDNSYAPVTVALPDGLDMIDMQGGYLHSVAVTDLGDVYSWGSNALGQLGDGTQTARSAPKQSLMPSGTNAVEVAAGQYHSLALTDDGKVYAWGANNTGQLGNGTTVATPVLTPALVTFPGTMTGTVVRIASHNLHNAAITSTGEVYTWGDNTYGQIGNGTTARQTSPVRVTLPGGATAASVAVGAFHTLVVTTTGTAFAWGYNRFGQLGNGTSTPDANPSPVAVILPADTTLREVDAGLSHSLAITNTGRALAWGANSVGQLGNATTNPAGVNVPVSVHLPVGVELVGIAGGESHSLAVTTTGRVLAWGLNNYGQLGENNSVAARTTPTYVDQAPGTVADGVAAGRFHSLVR